jgi:hypothetical protein
VVLLVEIQVLTPELAALEVAAVAGVAAVGKLELLVHRAKATLEVMELLVGKVTEVLAGAVLAQ